MAQHLRSAGAGITIAGAVVNMRIKRVMGMREVMGTGINLRRSMEAGLKGAMATGMTSKAPITPDINTAIARKRGIAMKKAAMGMAMKKVITMRTKHIA